MDLIRTNRHMGRDLVVLSDIRVEATVIHGAPTTPPAA